MSILALYIEFSYYDADANTAIVWSIVPEAREAYAAGDAAYVAEDYAAAFEQCRRAAELGYAEAQTELGYFYFYGDSVEQDTPPPSDGIVGARCKGTLSRKVL